MTLWDYVICRVPTTDSENLCRFNCGNELAEPSIAGHSWTDRRSGKSPPSLVLQGLYQECTREAKHSRDIERPVRSDRNSVYRSFSYVMDNHPVEGPCWAGQQVNGYGFGELTLSSNPRHDLCGIVCVCFERML